MDLQTKVNIPPLDFLIDYRTKLVMLGSCFAENIGEKFCYYKFQADVNPAGIIYNPFSVANILEMLLAGKIFEAEDLLQVDGKWVSLYHHGVFSDINQERCLMKINTRLQRSATNLETCDLLIITWGTAWVYRHLERGMIVSNCHKLPSREFCRYRLTVEEIVERYVELILRLREKNPALRVMFTVSPIRHWKDGAHGNQLSKATLLLAISQLQDRLAGIYYFPAYEIVLDELRDYRFFAEDMLHLSSMTVDYIWERLLESNISPHVLDLMHRVARVNKGLAHRPFEEQSPAYLKLLEKLLAEMEMIMQLNPAIDFKEERVALQAILLR